jgi:hypothetical protein
VLRIKHDARLRELGAVITKDEPTWTLTLEPNLKRPDCRASEIFA